MTNYNNKAYVNSKEYSLSNIAGYEEEKKEAIKIINLLKNHQENQKMGIFIPKGLILSGRPGVGKTLMAKVIASEAGVPLYEYDLQEDDDYSKLVINLKKIYEEARKNSPSIIFIDELDEIVSNVGFESDYSRIIMKNLLTELDGIKSTESVLTITTTNRYDALCPALIRSGRFDKHIEFNLPDFCSRQAILEHYAKNKKAFDNIDFKKVAAKTEKFSGADLKTLVNETLIEVVSNGRTYATEKDFLNVIPQVLFKEIRRKVDEKPSDIICYHELGHFICSYVLKNTITTISTEQIGNIFGHVRPIHPHSSEPTKSYDELKTEAIISLGGYAAEQVFLGKTYTGSESDFAKFSDVINYMAWAGMLGAKYIFECSQIYARGHEPKSQSLKELTVKLFEEYLEVASKVINDNKDLITYLYGFIKKNKKLDSDEVEKLIDEFNKLQ